MTAVSSLGTDFHCVDDLDANMSIVSERTALAEAAARRITTPPLGLHYDAAYGYDIRGEVGKPFLGQISSQRIERELLKDERVQDVSASVETSGLVDDADTLAGTLTAAITLTDDSGPFDLVLTITDGVTIDLLTETL